MEPLEPTLDQQTGPGTPPSEANKPENADGASNSNHLIQDPAQFRPGDEFEEFRIIAILGSGAFATVYLARQLTAQRLVALKVSKRESAELVCLAKIDHPGVVRVYDQRNCPTTGLTLLYIEYVPGGTLESVVSMRQREDNRSMGEGFLRCIDESLLEGGQASPERSPLRELIQHRPWEQTVAWIGRQLADALSSAHDADILHLDIKPANVLVAADGLPKLTDFNVSLDTSEHSMDQAMGRGSLSFMSPEQLDAMLSAWGASGDGLPTSTIGERSDIYSLAMILWMLAYGGRPWDGLANEDQLIAQGDGLHEQLIKTRQLYELRPDGRQRRDRSVSVVGAALRETLSDALAVDPVHRPASAREFADRLRLAMHPGAARIIQPAVGTIRRWIGDLSLIAVTAGLLLIPNILAGGYNYYYNESEILIQYPQMRSTFGDLATTINVVAYPLAVVLYVRFLRPLVRAYRGDIVTEEALNTCWNLGFRSATIGGVLWSIAGLIYALTLRWYHPEFPVDDMLHFCLSLVICGGIAWTVPFFVGTALGLLVYYPRLIRRRMSDDRFERRRRKLRRLGGRYVLAAVLVPLAAAALHTMRATPKTSLILAALMATAAGLVLAFKLYQYVESELDLLGRFLDE